MLWIILAVGVFVLLHVIARWQREAESDRLDLERRDRENAYWLSRPAARPTSHPGPPAASD